MNINKESGVTVEELANKVGADIEKYHDGDFIGYTYTFNEAQLEAYTLTAREEGRRELLDELAHEQKKFLDGFGHHKNCPECKTLTDNNTKD